MITGLAAGFEHACALTILGGVKCWGANWSGQIGNGRTKDRKLPTDVLGLGRDVTAIAVGYGHTCALTSAGGVKCWGANSAHQLGNGSAKDRHTPVEVSGLASGVIAISAGTSHTCALVGGGVKCWGATFADQIGNDRAKDGRVPDDVPGLMSDVTSISAGGNHTCALTSAGAVKCWGSDVYLPDCGESPCDYESVNIPTVIEGLSKGVVAISTGGDHSCAITDRGGVKCWGYNDRGQLGNGSRKESHRAVDVSGLSGDVTAISAGGWHTCALKGSGEVACWGDNTFGELGNGKTTEYVGVATPVNVKDLSGDVVSVAAGGGYYTCALMSDGGVKCWGSGTLGNSQKTRSKVPVDVEFAR